MGAFLGWKYASLYPERVEKLLLIGPMTGSSTEHRMFLEELGRRLTPYQEKLQAIQAEPGFATFDPEIISRYYLTIFSEYLADPKKIEGLNLGLDRKGAEASFKVFPTIEQSFLLKPYDFYEEMKTVKNAHSDNSRGSRSYPTLWNKEYPCESSRLQLGHSQGVWTSPFYRAAPKVLRYYQCLAKELGFRC